MSVTLVHVRGTAWPDRLALYSGKAASVDISTSVTLTPHPDLPGVFNVNHDNRIIGQLARSQAETRTGSRTRPRWRCSIDGQPVGHWTDRRVWALLDLLGEVAR